MRLLNLTLFLFSIASFSQNKPLEVKINTIAFEDLSTQKRKFTINYEIKNLTNNTISFFLKPNTFIANAAASMTLFPIYKLYQNNIFTELDGPFYEKEGTLWEDLETVSNPNSAEAKVILQKIHESFTLEYYSLIKNYEKNGGKNTDEMWIYENQKLLQTVITLQPLETKSFVIKTYWDKNRYFNQDDIEYYLDEKDTYDFEITLHLKATLFKDKLSPSEFEKIATDKYFIEGIFVSNKVKINLN